MFSYPFTNIVISRADYIIISCKAKNASNQTFIVSLLLTKIIFLKPTTQTLLLYYLLNKSIINFLLLMNTKGIWSQDMTKIQTCCTGSSSVSLPPHNQKMMGLILEGDTNICYYGLDRFSSKHLMLLTRNAFVRWYRGKTSFRLVIILFVPGSTLD